MNRSCAHNRSRDQHSVGGHPSEVRWIASPSEGKTLTAVTQEMGSDSFLCFDFVL